MGGACLAFPGLDVVMELRVMMHRALDEWIDGLEASFAENPSPSLMELSELFQQSRAQLLAASMKAAIERLFPSFIEQQWAHCPKCERQLRRKRFEPKEVSTLQGSFVLERPYFYCCHCHFGFHPLDEIVKLADELHQHDIEKRVSKLAANVPYQEAAKMFEELTGLKVGNHFAHETVNAVAEEVSVEEAIPDREEISRRITKATGPGVDQPVLVVASDGAHAPTRPRARRSAKRGKGSWQEAKGFRLYLLDSGDRIHHVASWHQIQDHEGLSKALELTAERIDQTKVRVVLLGDGASWVWNTMVKHFPQGVQILDFYHVMERLHEVGKLQFGENSERSHEWAEATMVRLCEGHYRRVIASLGSMKPRNPQAEAEIGKLIGYLQNHGPKMNYGEALAKGYPIGSGGIESANKYICHTRLKRSGAWWVDEMANNVLRIRCAIYNQTFDKAFEHYVRSRFGTKQRQERRQNE